MSMESKHYPAIDAKREELGIPKTKMAEKLELSWEGLNAKLCGEREFNLSEVTVLADWWGISLDELVGRRLETA